MKRSAPSRRTRGRRRAEQAIRERVQERSEGQCEARITAVCTGPATQQHHRKLRSQGGQDTEENLLDLCAACHAFAHANATWAVVSGLIVPSWANPDEFPVSHVRWMAS